MDRTGFASVSSWQRVQIASPFRPRSICAGASWPQAFAETHASRTNAGKPVVWCKSFIDRLSCCSDRYRQRAAPRCRPPKSSVLRAALQREDPVDQIPRLVGVLGLHLLVFFLMTVVELHFLAAGNVVDELLRRLRIALVLCRRIAQRRSVLLFVDCVTLEASAALGQRLCRARIGRPGVRDGQARQNRENRENEAGGLTEVSLLLHGPGDRGSLDEGTDCRDFQRESMACNPRSL